MLIDGGRRDAGEKVVTYLKKSGIEHLDYVVASHPDADHVGGLIEVLREVEVEHVLDSGKEHTTDTYIEYLKLVEEREIPFDIVNHGETIDFAPPVEMQALNALSESEERNESSIVFKITHGEIDFLLASDATKDNEMRMVNEFDVEAEILKVGHHGSKTSTSMDFLRKVQPETAILTYGENEFGHPTRRVVSRLNRIGATIYSTYEHGDIVVTADTNSYNIETEKWYAIYDRCREASELIPSCGM